MTESTITVNIPVPLAAAGPEAHAAWAEFVAMNGLKPSTRQLYRNRAGQLLTWLEPQSIGLAAVTRATVDFDDPSSADAIVNLVLIIGCAAGVFERFAATADGESQLPAEKASSDNKFG